MKYRILGKTGWNVSAVSFGSWGLGGSWGPVDDKTAISTVQSAFENGVNLYDTADAYGEPMGRSERLLGRALQGKRDDVFIATKVGNWAARFGHRLPFTHPLHVTLCCEASLYRLDTDYIDLLQCHIGNLTDPDIFLEAFDNLIEQGKIRAFGISTDSLEVAQAFNRDGKCATVQLNYSFLNRTPEKDLLPWCRENNIGTLIRGPLHKGVCTGKFSRDTKFSTWVRDKWNTEEGRKDFLSKLETVENLRTLEKPERTLAQAALQFVLQHPAVSTCIPGAKNINQVEDNSKAADCDLTEEELELIEKHTSA